MRRACIRVAILTVVTLLLVPSPATARQRTYVTNRDCRHVRIRPRAILFTCADHTYFVRRLGWSHWGGRKAIGTGVFHLNDCDPSCAEGTFHHRKGKLVLRGRRWCPDLDKYVFKRYSSHYNRPLLGRDSEAGLLPLCPTAS